MQLRSCFEYSFPGDSFGQALDEEFSLLKFSLTSVESVGSTVEDLATTFGANIGGTTLAAAIVATAVLAYIVTGLQVTFLSPILTLLEY